MEGKVDRSLQQSSAPCNLLGFKARQVRARRRWKMLCQVRCADRFFHSEPMQGRSLHSKRIASRGRGQVNDLCRVNGVKLVLKTPHRTLRSCPLAFISLTPNLYVLFCLFRRGCQIRQSLSHHYDTRRWILKARQRRRSGWGRLGSLDMARSRRRIRCSSQNGRQTLRGRIRRRRF